MADKKQAGNTAQASRTARRSMGLVKTQPTALAWAWERGHKVGQGRKPDLYLFNEEDVVAFEKEPELWHVVRAASQWVGSGTAAKGGKR